MYCSLNKVIVARSKAEQNGVFAHPYFFRIMEETSKISPAKYFTPFSPSPVLRISVLSFFAAVVKGKLIVFAS
jgi:hypothetical protein